MTKLFFCLSAVFFLSPVFCNAEPTGQTLAKVLMDFRAAKTQLKNELPEIRKAMQGRLGSLTQDEKEMIENIFMFLDALPQFGADISAKDIDFKLAQQVVTSLADLHFSMNVQHYETLGLIPKDRILARELFVNVDSLLLKKIKEFMHIFKSQIPEIDTGGSKFPSYHPGLIDENMNEVPAKEEIIEQPKGKIPGNFMNLMQYLNSEESLGSRPYSISFEAPAEGLFNFSTVWGKNISTHAENMSISFTLARQEETGEIGINPDTLRMSISSPDEHKNLGEYVSIEDHTTKYPKLFQNGKIPEGLTFERDSRSGRRKDLVITYKNGILKIVKNSELTRIEGHLNGEYTEIPVDQTQTATIEMTADLSRIGRLTYEHVETRYAKDGTVESERLLSRTQTTGPVRFWLDRGRFTGRNEIYAHTSENEYVPLAKLGNLTGEAFRSESLGISSEPKTSKILLLKSKQKMISCESLF